ncbi:MAG: DUF86 domain-containing protein [Candidatus Methanoplasma sp.]|nr:DUF86 domain-containing protein [Candidatus Methanoplasma sp.]
MDNIRVIVKYCEDLEYLTKVHGSDEDDFQENISLQYSCVFSLEQIGEHIKRLSSVLKDAHPEVDWRGASGMRDKIAHRYDSMDLSWIRLTILNDIPILENVCRNILSDQ